MILQNDGRGRFTDVTVASLPDIPELTFSVATGVATGDGDGDGDGDIDLMFGNNGATSKCDRMFLNNGRPMVATAKHDE